MPGKKSTYVNEEGDIRERMRLKRQEDVLNRAITPLQGVDLSSVHDVLDIACGTGKWCIDFKRNNPDKCVIGIDNDKGMIEFASAQADIENVDVDFLQMSALEPLKFSDASFDLVRMRLIGAFMKRDAWPVLLQECKRILRPGGMVVVIEQESLISNDTTLETHVQVMYTAMHRVGYTFAQDNAVPHLCIGIMMKSLLQDAGFANIMHQAHDVEFSTGSQGHEPFLHNLSSAFENGTSFLQRFGGVGEERIKEAQAYLKSCINKPGLIGFWHFISAIGYKLLFFIVCAQICYTVVTGLS
jgi:ubiquinone/menaquinone biosynthesis C-methylase UbiE